jgi:hypothetical protein
MRYNQSQSHGDIAMNRRIISLALSLSQICFATVMANDPAGEVGAGYKGAGPGRPGHVVAQPSRSITAIRLDASKALRAEAIARRAGDSTNEVLRLVELYREMATHPERATSDSLKQLGMQVESRLRTVREKIQRTASAQHRLAKKSDSPRKFARSPRVLAQQAAPPAAGQGAAANPAAANPPTSAQSADFGLELVELIQATVSPATWDINGGPGAIVYYSPLRVLVVNAPSDVHEKVGGAVGQLRASP